MIINQQIIITTITRNVSKVEWTITPIATRQILLVTFVGGGDTKQLPVKIEGKVILVIIYEPILKAKLISLLSDMILFQTRLIY